MFYIYGFNVHFESEPLTIWPQYILQQKPNDGAITQSNSFMMCLAGERQRDAWK